MLEYVSDWKSWCPANSITVSLSIASICLATLSTPPIIPSASGIPSGL